MHFSKYHALGNDYLVLDPRDGALPDPEGVRKICHRNFGLGSDGILFGPLDTAAADVGLQIWNPDGSEAEKWYKKAALLADEDAMYNLGILYGEGTVYEKNYPRALAWLGAAYDHRQSDALEVAKLISTRMNEEQLITAGVLRDEINGLLYNATPDEQKKELSEPPVARTKLLNTEQLIDTYSGHSVNFTFRDSVATETYRKHSSKKKALAGKKSKLKGEYRDGFYKGKWWVEDDKICFDYAKIDVFDACFWVEKLSENEMRTYSQKTGDVNLDKITK